MADDEDDKFSNRGWVYNWRKLSRPVSFEGLRWGNCTPMDIDLHLCFSRRVFVYGEAKERGAPLWNGQRNALEANVLKAGKGGIALVFEHAPEVDVIVAAPCPVIEIYRHRDDSGFFEWRPPAREGTVKEVIDEWLRYHRWDPAKECYGPAQRSFP